MCEFKVLKLEGEKTIPIGKDVMYFAYNEEGNSRFADILGRPSGSPNAFVTEVNMFESRHDITIIESDIIPAVSNFLRLLNKNEFSSNSDELKNNLEIVGNKLIKEIQDKIKKSKDEDQDII